MIWSRDDIVDVLVRDDESIVLTSVTCLRLTPVPTVIVELLEHPRSVAELQGELGSRFGEAPDGRLEDILDELAQQGVLRRVDDHPLG